MNPLLDATGSASAAVGLPEGRPNPFPGYRASDGVYD